MALFTVLCASLTLEELGSIGRNGVLVKVPHLASGKSYMYFCEYQYRVSKLNTSFRSIKGDDQSRTHSSSKEKRCVFTLTLTLKSQLPLTTILSGTVNRRRDSSEREWIFRRMQRKTMDNEENTTFLSLKGRKRREVGALDEQTSFACSWKTLIDYNDFPLLKLEITPECSCSPPGSHTKS